MMDYGMGWGFGGLAMLFFWVVPLILVLVGIKYLYSGRGSKTGNALPSAEAAAANPVLSLLEERYAKGEIDRDEFLQKRGDILGK